MGHSLTPHALIFIFDFYLSQLKNPTREISIGRGITFQKTLFLAAIAAFAIFAIAGTALATVATAATVLTATGGVLLATILRFEGGYLVAGTTFCRASVRM